MASRLEIGGVADSLFSIKPIAGKLGFSWPKSAEQIPVNVGDAEYQPLFPFGYGLTTASPINGFQREAPSLFLVCFDNVVIFATHSPPSRSN